VTRNPEFKHGGFCLPGFFLPPGCAQGKGKNPVNYGNYDYGYNRVMGRKNPGDSLLAIPWDA